jgi:hypothetical protein
MGHEGALGDTCTDDSQCGEGLTCFDNFCALGEKKKDEDEDEDDGDAPRFYFDLSGGVAANLVTNSTSTDISPPPELAQEAVNSAEGLTGDEKLTAAQDTAAAGGWNCNVAELPDGRLSFNDCKTTVSASGFVATPVLTGTIGYFITPRFALEGFIRFPLKTSPDLSSFGAGARAELLLSEPQGEGFHAGLLAGVLLGKAPVQAKAPQATGSMYKGPYAASGPFGVQLGMRLGYHFTRNVGVIVTPVANLMFANFMFALDLTAGLRFAF